MKIAVCIKRVPDMESRFRIASAGSSVDETGLKWDMGDFDGYAVEVALQLTEKHGGEVVAVSLGPRVVQETLRKALSMGVARGVHLEADSVPPDPLAIARAIASELEGGGWDLVLFGKVALDSGSAGVGPMVAELLGISCVTAISSIEAQGDKAVVGRALEGASETIEVPFPAVLTIDEGIARPRYPALKGIMAAKKKPLESKPAQLGEVRVKIAKMELPADRPPGRIVGEGAEAVPELVRLLRTEAKVI